MATAVYTTEEVTLQDGTNVVLKPLNIATLRVFMKYMDEFGESQGEDAGLEVLLASSALCASRGEASEWYDPDKERTAEREKDGSDEKEVVKLTKGGHTPKWEKVADLPTIYHILDICGGVKLNDPNLIAAAMGTLGTD